MSLLLHCENFHHENKEGYHRRGDTASGSKETGIANCGATVKEKRLMLSGCCLAGTVLGSSPMLFQLMSSA